MNPSLSARHQSDEKPHPVYFVSDRPEAYELWGEVSHEQAHQLAETIVRHAAKHFRGIEFRIDGHWHTQAPGTEPIANYIESHWQSWAAVDLASPQAA